MLSEAQLETSFLFSPENKRRNAKGQDEGLQTEFTFAWISTVAARHMGSWHFVITWQKYFEI